MASTRCCIKAGKTEESCEDTHTVIVRSTVYHNYWVKFSNGKIEIGRKGEKSPIISFNDRPNTENTEDAKYDDILQVLKENTPASSEYYNNTAVWKEVSGGVLPEDAVQGGDDPNCTLFVGRAYHEGEQLPGKICTANKVCYVPWGGQEHMKTEYEVLTGNNYEWVPYVTGASLVNAVPGGKHGDGTTLYIGRTKYNNTLTPGKVYPLTGLVYIGYGGLERTSRDFEILMFRPKRIRNVKC